MVNREHCDVCGEEITSAPIIKTYDGQEKKFCCQGCSRVYQAAYDNGMIDQAFSPTRGTKTRERTAPLKFQSIFFSIQGMWCAGCATAAENILLNQPGVKSVDISFTSQQGRIEYAPAIVSAPEILKKLDALGYHARPLSDESTREADNLIERMQWKLIVAIAFGMQVMMFYLTQLYPYYSLGEFNTQVVRNLQYLVWGFTTPILFYSGSSFLTGAWRAIRAHTASMDTLVAMGTLSAYFYSAYIALTGNGEVYFDSIVMITLFIMIGRYLENIGGAQARKDIQSLLQLQPDEAHLKTGKTWTTISTKKVAVDNFLLVKPGERIPADGMITTGSASINESVLTGESLPVDKKEGDFVFAGTLVQDSAIQLQVTRPVGKSRLSQITQLVEDTLSQKPNIQRLADKYAAFFAFFIIGVALITLMIRTSIHQPLSQSLLTSVSVLVVACPCALGLATPLALVVTLGRATNAGLIVRNQQSLETSTGITDAIFDKTGTLTLGKLSVEKIGIDKTLALKKDKILQMAASVEQFSEHSIGKAIRAAYPGETSEPKDFKISKGYGAQGRLDGKLIKIGTDRYFEKPPSEELMKRSRINSNQGQTIVWIGWDEQPIAFISLRDEPNPTAKEMVTDLKIKGIKVSMLSGDSPETCKAIAQEIGIDDFTASCTPDEKAKIVKQRIGMGGKVAFAGDGVNDAPALAQADLSFTAAGGTDIAGETSDVILTKPDLNRIPWFIRLSEKSRRVIRMNLIWAFAYNMVSVPLAALGLIKPVIAAAAMACSSLLVVGNSIRLRRMDLSAK